MMEPETDRLLTVFEAEQLTGRKAATWRKDILKRRIPYVKIGRQVRIPLREVRSMIAAGYRRPIAAPTRLEEDDLRQDAVQKAEGRSHATRR